MSSDDPTDPEDEKLRQIFESVRHLRFETGPVALSEEYRRAVEFLETLPEHQSGADKTWVLTTLRRSRGLLARAVQVR